MFTSVLSLLRPTKWLIQRRQSTMYLHKSYKLATSYHASATILLTQKFWAMFYRRAYLIFAIFDTPQHQFISVYIIFTLLLNHTEQSMDSKRQAHFHERTNILWYRLFRPVKCTPKLRKFATNMNSRQNSVSQYFCDFWLVYLMSLALG